MSLLLCASAQAADSPFVEAHIRLISTTKTLVGVGIRQGNTAQGIVIPTDVFSDEIVYRGPARFELIELGVGAKQPENKVLTAEQDTSPTKRTTRGFRPKPRSDDFTPSGKPPFAWIDLPANQGRLNLILLIAPGHDHGIIPLPDVPGSFPPGSNRYLNLCPFPVVAMAPSGRQSVPAGGTKAMRPGARNNDYYDLQFMSVSNEEEKLAFSSRVYHQESLRTLFVLTPGPGNDGRMHVRVIEDRPGAEKVHAFAPGGLKDAK